MNEACKKAGKDPAILEVKKAKKSP